MEETSLSYLLSATVPALTECNRLVAPYGLALTAEELEQLGSGCRQALRDTGRVDFGGGILKPLLLAFRSSPWLTQSGLADTLLILQDAFYVLKSDLADALTDGELLDRMRRVFDGPAAGDAAFLAELSGDMLLRLTGDGPEDAPDWENFS